MTTRSAPAVPPYRVRARNTATESANKMHDDAVARRFGFAGGLVPGVDVWAYLAHLAAEAWGRDWLERGTMAARFAAPVYDAEEVEVVAAGPVTEDGVGLGVDLEARGLDGSVRASGRAGLPAAAPPLPSVTDHPAAPCPEDPPPASPESLPVGKVLGAVEATLTPEAQAAYLDGVGETLPIFRDLAHPGWLLRQANALLVANVTLGPWIHVGSDARHLGAVAVGASVSTRGRVVAAYEKKGHRFVELDVLSVADATTPVVAVRHTAIYEPRLAAPAE